MGEIVGRISGIGIATERINEITADDLATLRHFQIGWDYGVINRQGYNFSTVYSKGTSTIEVGRGIMFAYGYIGYVDKCKLEFIRPSIPQYYIIYVELDRSKIPNTCTLKVKNNQSSPSIVGTFRQDYLDKIRTGVFQLPLYIVKIGSNGIENVKAVDNFRPNIKQVEYAPQCRRVVGEVAAGAKVAVQPLGEDNSERIATTDFVHRATRAYIDNSTQ